LTSWLLPLFPHLRDGRICQRSVNGRKPGPVEVAFGQPLYLSGEDYQALAKQVEQAVREL
jgi:hypothetical protein